MAELLPESSSSAYMTDTQLSRFKRIPRVKIRDLQPQEPDAERPLVATSADLTAIEDAAWQSARERFALLQP